MCFHDFHLSKTDINYKSDQHALQITVHTFIDDTEEALQELESLEYKLFTHSEHVKSDSILAQYFDQTIQINLDGQPAKFKYLGKEESEDLVGLWAYLEIEEVNPFNVISVDHSLLMELFDDQRNIITIKVDSKSEAFHILSKSDHYKEINL